MIRTQGSVFGKRATVWEHVVGGQRVKYDQVVANTERFDVKILMEVHLGSNHRCHDLQGLGEGGIEELRARVNKNGVKTEGGGCITGEKKFTYVSRLVQARRMSARLRLFDFITILHFEIKFFQVRKQRKVTI